MKDVSRGLAAAIGVSIAAHAAIVLVVWPSGTPGGRAPRATPVIVARLVDAGEAKTTGIAEATPPADAAATAEPAPAPPAAPVESLPSSPATVVDHSVEAKISPAASVPPPPEAASAAPTARRAASDEAASPAVTAAGSSSGSDRCPQAIDDIDLEPAAAANTRGGVATLRVAVSDRGLVESVEVVSSSPPGLLDAAALTAAFNRIRFAPCLRAGAPVRGEVLYDVSVAPVGRGTETSGKTY